MPPDKEISAGKLLQQAAAVVGMSTSANIWQDLANALAKALRVDWVFVGKFSSASPVAARTLAVCHVGSIVENFDYEVESSAGNLHPGEMRIYGSKAVDHVRSEWVKQVQAEAFGEITLINSLGQAEGILAFAHSQPLEREDLIGPVLQIFAFKAAVELEHELSDNRFYRELLNDLLRPRRA
jgi:hypothetical protein